MPPPDKSGPKLCPGRGRWEGNTPSNQPNSAGVPSGGDPRRTPLPQAKPWRPATGDLGNNSRRHRPDSGSLRAETPRSAPELTAEAALRAGGSNPSEARPKPKPEGLSDRMGNRGGP